MARFTVDDCVAQRWPGRLLRRTAKLTIAYIESRFDAPDLNFGQWIAMKVVKDGVVSTAGELARELHITTGATTRLLDGLEEKGLLQRDRGGCGDRRVVTLHLTEKGRERLTALAPRVIGAWNDMFQDMDREEVEALGKALGKLLVRVEQLSAATEPSAGEDPE
jgi:DNA-binding MarR family transcriptional regulator